MLEVYLMDLLFSEEFSYMKRISEYKESHLRLMHESLSFFEKNRHLVSFENKKVDLSSLLINLENLFNSMEHITKEWEEKYLDEFSTLESINAEMPKMKRNEIDNLISDSVANLKKIVEQELKLSGQNQ